MLFFLNGCVNPTNEDIIGHWHLNKEGNEKKRYITLDVIDDTLAYINMNSLESETKGRHNKDKRLLLFPGGCGSGFFEYQNFDQTLYLKSIHNYGDYKGEICDNNCCNRLIDFKNKQERIKSNRISK